MLKPNKIKYTLSHCTEGAPGFDWLTRSKSIIKKPLHFREDVL